MDNLKGFMDTPAEWQAAREEKAWGATSSLNGRSSVKTAVTHLLGQVERGVRRRPVAVGDDDSRKQFELLFPNKESSAQGLNKAGLLSALLKHDLQITAGDMDLLFPLIDADNSGRVTLDEIADFLHTQRQSVDEQTRFGTHDPFLRDAAKELRQSRIGDKTNLQEEMIRISIKLRAALGKIMKERSLTAKQLFDVMDKDHGGTVDRAELCVAMQQLPIEISVEEMDIVWPHFELDYFGTISSAEFKRFMKGRELSYKFVQDKFIESRDGRNIFRGRAPKNPSQPPATCASRWRGRSRAAAVRRRKIDTQRQTGWITKAHTPAKLEPSELDQRAELCATRVREKRAADRNILRTTRPLAPRMNSKGRAVTLARQQALQRVKQLRTKVVCELQKDVDMLVGKQDSSVEAMHVAHMLSPRHQEDLRYQRNIRPRSKQEERLGRIMAGANDMAIRCY
jgi:Ca2+-binding EF-hand superfamily protein